MSQNCHFIMKFEKLKVQKIVSSQTEECERKKVEKEELKNLHKKKRKIRLKFNQQVH